MLAAPRLRARRSVVCLHNVHYGAEAVSVAPTATLQLTPEGVVLVTGAVRAAVGVLILVAPAASARAMGTDSATAKRVSYLARMAAGRDVGLGVGVLSAGSSRAAVPWVLAGAAADTVDAVAIAAALKTGAARGLLATAVVVAAAGSAVGGFWAASRLRR